jgi:hypothetical protein
VIGARPHVCASDVGIVWRSRCNGGRGKRERSGVLGDRARNAGQSDAVTRLLSAKPTAINQKCDLPS